MYRNFRKRYYVKKKLKKMNKNEIWVVNSGFLSKEIYSNTQMPVDRKERRKEIAYFVSKGRRVYDS